MRRATWIIIAMVIAGIVFSEYYLQTEQKKHIESGIKPEEMQLHLYDEITMLLTPTEVIEFLPLPLDGPEVIIYNTGEGVMVQTLKKLEINKTVSLNGKIVPYHDGYLLSIGST